MGFVVDAFSPRPADLAPGYDWRTFLVAPSNVAFGEVLTADPNRVAVMFQSFLSDHLIFPGPPPSGDQGFRTFAGGGPIQFTFSDFGPAVGSTWSMKASAALNGIHVLTVSWRGVERR